MKRKPKCKACGSQKSVRLVSLKTPMGLYSDKRPVWLCRKCERRERVDR